MKRRKTAKRKKTPKWYAPFAILFVLGAVVVLPGTMRNWGDRLPIKIRQLHVEGTKALSSIDLKSMAGFHKGEPLFGEWGKDVVKKLKEHPRIERVTVARDATGKVFVRVAERKAAAMVNLDRLYFVDREGNLLGPADLRSPEADDLVVFTGPWRKVPAVGMKEQLVEGLGLYGTLVDVGMEETRISELHFDRKLGWVLYRTSPAVRVILGKEQFTRKAKRLARVLRDFKGKEELVREVDLSFRDRAIVKMRSAG